MIKNRIVKRIIIIGCSAIALLSIAAFAFSVFLFQDYIHIYFFEYDNYNLGEQEYALNFPQFRNRTVFRESKKVRVYDAINSPMFDYAIEVYKEYDHNVKLYYSVSHPDGSTLVVDFFGLGYPDNGEGEVVQIDKTFRFDISNVSDTSYPKLIEGDA